MTILIVEDEVPAQERLLDLLQELGLRENVVGITTSTSNTIEWLNSNAQPNLLLMDIELSDGKSFEIFNHVRITGMIVFITAYDEYLSKSFEVNSINYILKPIKKADLEFTIRKYEALKQNLIQTLEPEKIRALLLASAAPPTVQHTFLVKQGTRLIPIQSASIAYFFFEERNTFLVTSEKVKYLISYTMEELEKIVDQTKFYRVNRAFIVNRHAVEKIKSLANQKLEVFTQPGFGKEILVSREKAIEFKKWMINKESL